MNGATTQKKWFLTHKIPVADPEKSALLFLLRYSFRSIPFNILLGLLLALDLYYNHSSLGLIGLWLMGIILVSVGRIFFSKWALMHIDSINIRRYLYFFTALCFLGGATFGSIYFLFMSHMPLTHEFIIILVLGGMAAGAIASLSVFLPAYYVYLLSIFLPVIGYNLYLFSIERMLLAVMFILFTIMLMITAILNFHLWQQVFMLVKDKENLIMDLKEANKKQKGAFRSIKKMSITDFLTGIYNRRHFMTVLQNEFSRAKRNGYPFTLVLIDIDDFKSINDNFGHPYGDQCLVQVAYGIRTALRRSSDAVFRTGGDEFAMLIINQNLEQSLHICATITERVKAETMPQAIELSMGLLTVSPNTLQTVDQLITIADSALYEAKKDPAQKIVSRVVS